MEIYPLLIIAYCLMTNVFSVVIHFIQMDLEKQQHVTSFGKKENITQELIVIGKCLYKDLSVWENLVDYSQGKVL